MFDSVPTCNVHYYNYIIQMLEYNVKIENKRKRFCFIPSSEFNAYLKQIKVKLSAVKIFSIVTNTINIFSL